MLSIVHQLSCVLIVLESLYNRSDYNPPANKSAAITLLVRFIFKLSMKVKENWQRWSPEQAKTFLRWGPEGKHHPSRLRVLGLIEGLSSVLDVGCGNGVMFEIDRKSTRL